MAAPTDKPIAELLKELKQRGLLDSTLIVWGGEFGRTPEAQGAKGRDHNNTGVTMWMSGGGAVTARSTTSDSAQPRTRIIFATFTRPCCTQLGLNQNVLPYLHQGRRERLTEIQREVIRAIV
jgi:Protein of unknown function (DUF1501)